MHFFDLNISNVLLMKLGKILQKIFSGE